ncbi:hypothetical protein BKA61DRAFT_651679 [Leptodontidium sp. MPI-SDFR-AT-0119]|nr:hypothetical protein BKA61DRAFT_651679 [Leptodontidium sp. MPI-SDFR-AT-0119]
MRIDSSFISFPAMTIFLRHIGSGGRKCSVEQSWKTLYAGNWWLSHNMEFQESMANSIELDYREKVGNPKTSSSRGSSFWDNLRLTTFSGLEAQELTVNGAIFVILRDRLLHPHFTRAIDRFQPGELRKLLIGLLDTYFEDITTIARHVRHEKGYDDYYAKVLYRGVDDRGCTRHRNRQSPGEDATATNTAIDLSSPSNDIHGSKTEPDAEPRCVGRDMYELLVCSPAWWKLADEFTKVLEIKTEKVDFKSRRSVVQPNMMWAKVITAFGKPNQLSPIPTITRTECVDDIASKSDSASNLESEFPQDQTADRAILDGGNSIKAEPLASFVGRKSDDDGSVSESGSISASAAQPPKGWCRNHPLTGRLFDPIRDMILGRPLSPGIFRFEWMCECGYVGYGDYPTTKEDDILSLTEVFRRTTGTTSPGTQSIQMGVIGAGGPSTSNALPGPKRSPKARSGSKVAGGVSSASLLISRPKFELFPKSKIVILDYKQLPPSKKKGKEYEWEHHLPVVSTLALHWFDNPEDAGDSTIFVRRFPKKIRERLETVEHPQ